MSGFCAASGIRFIHHKKPTRLIIAAGAVAGALLACPAASRGNPPQYHITMLGLSDAEHTRNDGSQNAGADLLNDRGQVAGRSVRYNGGAGSLGISAWLYDGNSNIRIGLTDAFHTSSGGVQWSQPQFLNNSARVAGFSKQYNGGGSESGRSAWLYSGGGSTIRLGFTDAPHTAADGSSYSEPIALNDLNQVLGISARYDGSQQNGQSLWLYSNGQTTRIGLTDSQHTSSTGQQTSGNAFLNQVGQIAGNSQRYSGSADLGTSAWLYSGGSYTPIGLTDAAHTSSDGVQNNSVYTLDNAGRVTGSATRYSGTTEMGRSIWLASAGVTTRVGFFDAEHTAADGYQYSDEWDANSAGQVAGISYRYNGSSSDLGQSAWIHSAGVTQRVGFHDAGYTDVDGYQNSGIYGFNNAGHAMGYSERYSAGLYRGDAAWVARNGVTTRIGLVDPDHTRSSGFQYSEADTMNNVGQVIGWSNYFVNDNWIGDDAWLWNGSSTVQLGLLDSQHTAADGTRTSYAYYLNDAGQVTGESDRYNGNVDAGQSGWFYDPATQQTTPLVFSTASDGYARTDPWDISSDGAVIGTYEIFSGGADLGTSLFYWSAAEGFHDVGELVSGGLAAAGWSEIADLRDDRNVNGFPYIVGYGTRTAGYTMPYLLRVMGGGAWTNAAGGNWNASANWSLGAVPTAYDDAVFSLPNTYSVNLSNDAEAHGVTVSAGQVTLNLSGHHLRLTDATHVGAARLTISGAGTLRSSAITLEAGAHLDITDTDVIIDYSGASPLASIRASIHSGALASSMSDPHKTIGSAENSVLGRASFGGEGVDATSVLLKLTYAGDANLDGQVDVTDLGSLATNWQTSGVWTSGDFNYDGFIDVTDLGALATNWQVGVGNPLTTGSLQSALAELGLGSTPIPEPTLAGGVVGTLCLALRRGRRR